MPQLTADAAQQHPQGPAAVGAEHQVAADETGEDGFAHVTENHDEGVFGTIGAVKVGESGIAAAVLAHIVPNDEVGGDHRAVEAAQQVRNQQRQPHYKVDGHINFHRLLSDEWRE